MHIGKFKNSILSNLDPETISRLGLRLVSFELRHEIEFPGKALQHLFFVEEGMASMTTTFDDGSQVEVGIFGCESVIGTAALMGTKRSLNRVYTQIAGCGYSCPVEAARREFRLGGRFQELTLRNIQAQLVETAQSAGCNAKHNVEQRLARWLLLCSARTNRQDFTMSHEFLADMLGSTRPTVSMAAVTLKREGLIGYTRGEITILNLPGLEDRACECYHIIRNHLKAYAALDADLPDGI